MEPDGSIHPTSDKGTVIHLLEGLVQDQSDTTDSNNFPQTSAEIANERNTLSCLVVDGMAVVQELMAVRNFNNCKDFSTSFVKLIDSKGKNYDQVRIIFDNYTKKCSLKEGTRQRCRGKAKYIKS